MQVGLQKAMRGGECQLNCMNRGWVDDVEAPRRCQGMPKEVRGRLLSGRLHNPARMPQAVQTECRKLPCQPGWAVNGHAGRCGP